MIARDTDRKKFVYRQIADQLQADIQKGQLKPGERLPSLNSLAETYRVNRITVLRAINRLKRSGLVYSVPAQGTFVGGESGSRAGSGHDRTGLTVGIISQVMMHGRIGAYHSDIIGGIQEALVAVEGRLSLVPLLHVTQDSEVVRMARQEKADAFIYVGPFHERALRRMLESGPTSVLVDYHIPGLAVDSVYVNNVTGGKQIMEHLLKLGHRRIAVINGPNDQPVGFDRRAGVQQALKDAGIPAKNVVFASANFSRESGIAAMRKLAAEHPEITAVACMNDDMAAGALQLIHSETNLKVPRDISVTGFDNINIAHATHPPLTTIHIDRRNLGRMAVERLLARMEEPEAVPARIELDTQLILRDSTAAPRGETN